MEKQLKNRALVGILNGLHDEGGRALLAKCLPAAVVFALRRNITWVESAYRDYHAALAAICRAHGTAVETLGQVTDPGLAHEVAELLDAETSVSVQAVSLDAAPEDFAAALAFAKDRPLLLRDGNSPAPSLTNSRLLHTALCGGTVPLFSGKNACRLPLRTLPLILGTDVSSLSALSSVICLNPRREDFSTNRPLQPAFSPEYGYALAAFVTRAHSRLAACLAEGKTWGCSLADRLGLSSGHGEVLAALEGIRRFLNDFFAGIDLPPAVPEDWWEGLAEAMTADRQRACPEGVAAIFLEGVRSMVRSERFS